MLQNGEEYLYTKCALVIKDKTDYFSDVFIYFISFEAFTDL